MGVKEIQLTFPGGIIHLNIPIGSVVFHKKSSLNQVS